MKRYWNDIMRVDQFMIACRRCDEILSIDDYIRDRDALVFYLHCPKCKDKYTVIQPDRITPTNESEHEC